MEIKGEPLSDVVKNELLWLSCSGLQDFLHCPFKFYALHILKIPRPERSFLFFGSCVDHAVNKAYERKKLTDTEMRPAEMKEVFAAKFDEGKGAVRDWEEDKPASLKDTGVKSCEVYHRAVYRRVRPKDVQPLLKIEFENSRFGLRGYPDVTQAKADGDPAVDIRDTKTTGKSWSSSKPRENLQTYAYPLLANSLNTTDNHTYDVLVKKKSPELQVFKEIVTPQRKSQFLSWLNGVTQQIQISFDRQSFPPTAFYRSDFLCSKKYCQASQFCAKINGLPIKD